MSTKLKKIEWNMLSGLDPQNSVWEIDNKIIRVSKCERFYAEMQIKSLVDIHHKLAPLNIAPKLEEIVYDEPFIFSIFEKLHSCDIATAYEIGVALKKAHIALSQLDIKKTFPWVGFYGEYNEFECIIPMIKNTEIRLKSEVLLKRITKRMRDSTMQYIHRDLNPDNVIKTPQGVFLIDWDMTHCGRREDDVAMSIICLAPMTNDTKMYKVFCTEFLSGYSILDKEKWIDCNSEILKSSIALSGLRQAAAGWFTDKGDLSEKYWENIFKRLDAALILSE